MKLKEVKKILNAGLLTDGDNLDMEIGRTFGCDLMSDVLALVTGDILLLTGLINIQTIRTAEMKDIKCVIFVRGKKPAENVIKLAQEMGISLMSTKYTMYTACGILYSHGVEGAEIE